MRPAAGVPDTGSPAALVFDLGQTLVGLDEAGFAKAFGALGASDRRLDRFRGSRADVDWNLGRLTPREFAGRLRDELNLTADDGALETAWATLIGAPLPGMVRLAERALGGGLRVALLSNTDPWHWKRALERLPLLERFSGRGLSFELGRAKPDPDAFAAAEAALELDPARTIFVDDREENLQAARARGLETWLHEAGRPDPAPALEARIQQLLETT